MNESLSAAPFSRFHNSTVFCVAFPWQPTEQSFPLLPFFTHFCVKVEYQHFCRLRFATTTIPAPCSSWAVGTTKSWLAIIWHKQTKFLLFLIFTYKTIFQVYYVKHIFCALFSVCRLHLTASIKCGAILLLTPAAKTWQLECSQMQEEICRKIFVM